MDEEQTFLNELRAHLLTASGRTLETVRKLEIAKQRTLAREAASAEILEGSTSEEFKRTVRLIKAREKLPAQLRGMSERMRDVVPAPEPEASIVHGRVTDPEGAGVEGIRVIASDTQGNVLGEATSDAIGSYMLKARAAHVTQGRSEKGPRIRTEKAMIRGTAKPRPVAMRIELIDGNGEMLHRDSASALVSPGQVVNRDVVIPKAKRAPE